MAERAKVSLGTVSNVLNRPWVVAGETRDRVQRAMRELDFVPNAAARRLRGGNQATVAVVFPDAMTTPRARMLSGIADRLEAAGRQLLLCRSAGTVAREAAHLRELSEEGIGGLVLCAATGGQPAAGDESLAEQLTILRGRGVRSVLVDVGMPVAVRTLDAAGDSSCAVAVDESWAGEIAAEHLLALGHSSIALVDSPVRSGEEAATATAIGVRRAVRRVAGTRLGTVSLTVAPDRAAERRLQLRHQAEAVAGVERMRKSGRTAIVCVGARATYSVARALTAAGLDVPGAMSVVAVGEVDPAAAFPITLTCVGAPAYDVGQVGVDLLLAEADPATFADGVLTLEPQLAPGGSTGPVRAAPS